MPVSPAEVRDLDFANDASKVLASIAGKLEKGTITQNERRYCILCQDCACANWKQHGRHLLTALCAFSSTTRAVTKLLEDLVFFVVDIPNNGQDVLEIMVNKPNRERQKLMREQNILKQVQQAFYTHTLCTLRFPFSKYELISTSLFRSSSCCRLHSQTVVTAPCCVWRSWPTSAMPPSDTSAACVTGFYVTLSRTTARTR